MYLQESMPNKEGSKSSLSVPGFGFFIDREGISAFGVGQKTELFGDDHIY